MASYPPPTETLPIFDAGVFTTNDSTLTISQADARYLKFPTGQGTETIPNLVVSGTATAPTFIGALTGNADTATRATNIAGGAGGSIPYQTAVNTSALLPNGTSGQVLTSQGTTLAPVWASAGASNLSAVLTAGNTATNSIALNNSGTGSNVISLLPNASASVPKITITNGTFTNTMDHLGPNTYTSANNATNYLLFVDSGTTNTTAFLSKTSNITCNPSLGKITALSLEATTSATISDQTIKQNSTNTIFNKTSSVTPSGIGNAFYGLESGLQTTTGGTNSAFGHTDTLKALTTGSSNSAFGSGASKTLISGSFNTAVGYNSAFLATQSNNTCLGARSGYNLTTGANNTFVGFGTETGTHTTGSNCTSLGYLANCANFASSTAIGANATNTATSQIMLGNGENVVIPGTATINNQTIKVDTGNTVFNKTSSTNPSGSNNAFYGFESGIATTTGGTNSGFGHLDTLKALTTGNSNSAFGTGALKTLISGSSNTAVGYNSANAVNTGSGNTSIGASNAPALTTGSNNTFLGKDIAPSNLTTGSNNTFLGADTITNLNCTKSTAIGQGATITASNQVVLGTSTESVIIPRNIRYLSSPMVAYGITGASQSLAHGDTTINYNVADARNGSYTGLTNSSGTITNSNSYSVTISASACINFSTNSTGIRFVNFSVGGNTNIGSVLTTPVATDVTQICMSSVFVLNSGESFFVNVFQNSGSTLTAINSGNKCSRLSMLVM